MTVAYLDASAAIGLVVGESESAALSAAKESSPRRRLVAAWKGADEIFTGDAELAEAVLRDGITVSNPEAL